MILALDIGNTNIKAGVFSAKAEKGPLCALRLSSSREKTPDEYGLVISGLLLANGIGLKGIKAAVISSVVPSLTGVLKLALEGRLKIRRVYSVPDDIRPPMPILIKSQEGLGADRLVNAYAAANIYGPALIVIDFGTAITFDYVTGRGEYAGGAIAPGIKTSLRGLSEGAAQLPRIELGAPVSAIGRDTVHAMASGAFWGFSGLVEGIVQAFEKEAGEVKNIIATGGECALIAGGVSSITHWDESLTLKGLNLAYRKAR